ncbi:hypothetical protein Ddc_07335 [Ditylenchus destructor]|nr:hypothetical protein Ddc_07335 [Ditylenchus destructor]
MAKTIGLNIIYLSILISTALCTPLRRIKRSDNTHKPFHNTGHPTDNRGLDLSATPQGANTDFVSELEESEDGQSLGGQHEDTNGQEPDLHDPNMEVPTEGSHQANTGLQYPEGLEIPEELQSSIDNQPTEPENEEGPNADMEHEINFDHPSGGAVNPETMESTTMLPDISELPEETHDDMGSHGPAQSDEDQNENANLGENHEEAETENNPNLESESEHNFEHLLDENDHHGHEESAERSPEEQEISGVSGDNHIEQHEDTHELINSEENNGEHVPQNNEHEGDHEASSETTEETPSRESENEHEDDHRPTLEELLGNGDHSVRSGEESSFNPELNTDNDVINPEEVAEGEKHSGDEIPQNDSSSANSQVDESQEHGPDGRATHEEHIPQNHLLESHGVPQETEDGFGNEPLSGDAGMDHEEVDEEHNQDHPAPYRPDLENILNEHGMEHPDGENAQEQGESQDGLAPLSAENPIPGAGGLENANDQGEDFNENGEGNMPVPESPEDNIAPEPELSGPESPASPDSPAKALFGDDHPKNYNEFNVDQKSGTSASVSITNTNN